MSWWELEVNCNQCGEKFKSVYFGNQAKYCSNKCRQKAYRERKKKALQSAPDNRNGQSITPSSRDV